MATMQAIEKPFGISVFGSSIIRMEPDTASIKFAVSRLEQLPKDAFREAREAAKQVREYLMNARMDDVSSSRVSLSQSFKHSGGESRFVGYTAKIAFHVVLRDLDRTEEILIGVTDAGANEISSVDYQTSRLKEIRAQARKQAIIAAREKAEIYCESAGVTLGPVIHIEDVNPERLRGREMHVTTETQANDDEPIKAFDPGSITVGGAVVVAYELGRM